MDARAIEESETISKALPLIAKYGFAIVNKEGEFAGMLDDRMLLGFNGDASRTLVSNLAHKTRGLAPEYTVDDVVKAFLEKPAKGVPVLTNGEVTRVLTRDDVLDMLLKEGALEGANVKDVMVPSVVTVTEETTLDKAQHMLMENKLYKLVVTDDSNRVKGVVSAKDVSLMNVLLRDSVRDRSTQQDRKRGTVSDFMRSPAITAREGEKLADAARRMLEAKVSLLVVEQNGVVKGVISVTDMLKALVPKEMPNVTISGLRNDERVLQESILEEGRAFMRKWGSHLRIDSLALHVKSAQEGAKRRYEVKANAVSQGRRYQSREQKNDFKASMWDAHLAVKETLDELRKIMDKEIGKKHSRPQHEREEGEQD